MATSRKSANRASQNPTVIARVVAGPVGGTLHPLIQIDWSEPCPTNVMMATVLRLAAAIYETRPKNSEWLVTVPSGTVNMGLGRSQATIKIETIHATDAEAEAAMKVLKGVAGVANAR